MRTYLILLLLANLGYLAWRQDWVSQRPEPSTNPGQAPYQQAEQKLILLQELSPERRELMSSLAEARNTRAQSQQQMDQLAAEATTVESQIDEVTAEFAEDQARSAQVQNALLSTLDEALAAAEEGQGLSGRMPWCASAGIFPDQAAAASFVESLASFGIEAVIAGREVPVSSTWWVHMAPFASEAEAMDRLAELQARNIDSYYMRSGEMAGGISLGVYSRQESAVIAQQRLSGQGYATRIREVIRLGERLYVELAMPDAAQREAPEWKAFLASLGGIEVVENACEMIASEIEFP